ncbi:MAG: VTT domain-containing protein [Chloroflexota bacterium]
MSTTLIQAWQTPAPTGQHWSTKYGFGRKQKRPSFLQALTDDQPPQPRRSWLVTGVVAGAATAAVGWWWVAGKSVVPLAQQFIRFADASPYTTLVYGVGATLLPVAFFPATAVAIAGGILFGLAGGIVLTTVTQTAGGMIAYEIGYRLKQRTTNKPVLSEPVSSSTLAPYLKPLQERPFESVLITRLLYLPHEFVSYACGWLEIDKRPFFFGTALGLIPSTIVLTSVGAAIRNGVLASTSILSPTMLLINGGILAGSLVVAHYLRQSKPANSKNEEAFLAPQLG